LRYKLSLAGGLDWAVPPGRPGSSRHRCPGQRNAHYQGWLATHDRRNFVNLYLPDYHPIIDPSPDIDSRASTAISIFAAVITNLNRAGMSAGRRPLRFLNPWLYRDSYKALMDTADGGSIGCNGVIPYVS
jgi:hypothetical protein